MDEVVAAFVRARSNVEPFLWPDVRDAIRALRDAGLAVGALILYKDYIATYDLSLELLNLDGHGTVDLAGQCAPASMVNLQFAVAAVALIALGVSCKLSPCSV